MDKIRIGVICPSEIAYRRFMPALGLLDNFEFVGIGAATEQEFFGSGSDKSLNTELEKADKFVKEYGGRIFEGYEKMVSSEEIDAIYIPLPPALHFKWAKRALENGKHVLLEKPFTTRLKDTEALIELAKARNLAVHENYMFVYHSQLEYICRQIQDGAIGDIRLIRIDFGFPFRGAGDFRYDKALGGGALLDCGGYTLRLASLLLGNTAEVMTSKLNYKDGFDVDIYGSATLKNNNGVTAQVSFGMDNSYKCSLEIWGSRGTLYTNRILTAPVGYKPVITISDADGERKIELPEDNTFKKSISAFESCIRNYSAQKKKYTEIKRQSLLVEHVIKENNNE